MTQTRLVLSRLAEGYLLRFVDYGSGYQRVLECDLISPAGKRAEKISPITFWRAKKAGTIRLSQSSDREDFYTLAEKTP